MAEYGQLRNSGVQEKVPLANTGGAGTRGGHWREATFGNELMTGFLNTGNNSLSRLSIASVQDLGYEVNFDAADAFSPPSPVNLAALRRTARHVCRTIAPKPTVLPESAVSEE